MTEESFTGERIAKYLARAGIASRREVERMIEVGRVKVNGKALQTPAFKVTGKEKIEVDGKLVSGKQATRLWRYHKPSGLVTTHNDPEGRETVFDRLPKDMGRVISIGRLDLTSEGILLLTNDGELARALELPSTAWTRKYRVRAWGTINDEAIRKLRSGITVEGVKYEPIDVEIERDSGTNIWLELGLREGKNREIRRVLEAIGLQVNRLIRISYGPFQLSQMEVGEIKSVPAKTLIDQCGHLIKDLQAEDAPEPNARIARPKKRGNFGGAGQPGFAKPQNFIDEAGAHTGRDRRGKPGPSSGPKSGAKSFSKSGAKFGQKSEKRFEGKADGDKKFKPDMKSATSPKRGSIREQQTRNSGRPTTNNRPVNKPRGRG